MDTEFKQRVIMIWVFEHVHNLLHIVDYRIRNDPRTNFNLSFRVRFRVPTVGNEFHYNRVVGLSNKLLQSWK